MDMILLYEDDIFARSVYLTPFKQKQKVSCGQRRTLWVSIIIYALVLIWLVSVYFHYFIWRFSSMKKLQFYLRINFIGYEFSYRINSDGLFVWIVFTRFFTSNSLFYLYLHNSMLLISLPHSFIPFHFIGNFNERPKLDPACLLLFFSSLLLSLEHNAIVISSNISL